LLGGTAADRKGNVTAICQPAPNAARDYFNQKLSDVTTACIPASVGGQTSAFGVTLKLLDTVLCEQRAPVGGELRYCVLSILPLFDMLYFVNLATSGVLNPPSLATVAASLDRQTAMCESSVCNAFVEQTASATISNLPQGPNTAAAADYIRTTVNRMRCGCSVLDKPCHHPTVSSELIEVDANGKRQFKAGKGCGEDGQMTACARVFHVCEKVPKPTCEKPCTKRDIATVVFNLKNLNYDCLLTAIPAPATLDTIKADVIANIPGLTLSDFDLTCGVNPAPGTGTQCKLVITCSSLVTLANMNFPLNLVTLQKHAAALVVYAPAIDQAVFATCKIVPNADSFGYGFEIVSLETKFTEDSAASTLLVGVSVASSLLLSLTL